MRLLCFTAFVFGCAAALSAAPSITGVTNAAGTLPPGLPNSGVAQGAVFAVYGSGLGPPALTEAPGFPLPTTQGLGGTTVTVTVNGVTETCIMVYTVASQVAAVLPSATPVGTGTLTVTYQGASGSIAVQVLTAGFGVATLNESGTGPAAVTDLFYNPITMANPAHPGDNLILWGTGLGAVTGDETVPPVAVDLHTGVQVFIENQAAVVLYGGRSADPGLDQINFTVPEGISGGCKTSIAVLLKGVVANVTTTSIAPSGQSTCGDATGLTTAVVQAAVSTGSLTAANVSLYRFGTNDDTLESAFVNYSLDNLIRSYGGGLGPSIGSCTAFETLGTSVVTDPIQPPRLDAGATLSITGPAGHKNIAAAATGYYTSDLGASSSYIEAGNYTVSNGAGGINVAGFTWNLTLPAALSITNLPAMINRSQDLTVAWNNSAAFSTVSIRAVSGVPLASGQTAYVQFYCTAAASAGQFTIPSVMLQLLPTNGYGAVGSKGAAIEIAGIAANTFTVAGSPGLDVGVFNAFTYTGGIATVQ
jgi:uncharacterized protein (TIGR03437 family)